MLNLTLSARELVDGFVTMIGKRDPATAEHLDAVGVLARRLGAELGYEGVKLDIIELAGRMHDVGKHSVPLEILVKPGKLTADEWVEMRRHPEYGAGMLSSFAPLRPIVPIVRAHHERLDGRGYPDGLSGSAIPMESRIIAVADAFHAMTVTRPYQQAHSTSYALSELVAGKHTQFDADCVEAFGAMLGANHLLLNRNAAIGF